MIHVRHRHVERFTVVGNHLAQHPALSAVAIGIAVHIQSLPDGESVTAKALTLRFREGETTVRRALNELEAAGYVVRRRLPLGGGRFATRTFFYDRPDAEADAGAGRGPAGRRPAARGERGRAKPESTRPPGGPVRPRPGPGPGFRPGPAGPGRDGGDGENGGDGADGRVEPLGPGPECDRASPAATAAPTPTAASAPAADPASAPAPIPAAAPSPAAVPALVGAPTPATVPTPTPTPTPAPASGASRAPGPATAAPTAGPGRDLLVRLRLVDPRLVLSHRDVERLAPEVARWLDRSLTPEQVARALTAGLPAPDVPIHHPARFVAYRLSALLPPSLPRPSDPAPEALGPDPLVTCDGCERAFRTSGPEGTLCGSCRAAGGDGARSDCA
ncbi:hypothetical protein [Streptomyces fuscigenes]|uniref:hypothetical protein n=1 Tax=Streptomyces fuscigenes TaxID=1528880 RepID=UPI001F3EC1CB|nr:hypothetical protein [Streptomyces fuscigenes]MCF3961981.1 hypothetical protein [Streptomyces fuscigenes]